MTSASNPNLEGVMRRIQKLLAIANDDRANPNEAAAAAVMAEKVMRKYQLDHSDIILTDLKRGDDLETSEHLATAKTNGTPVRSVPLWASWIAVALGRYHDCGAKIIRRPDGQVAVRFYGYKNDIAVAGWTYDYLIATVNRLVKEWRVTSTQYAVEGRRAANAYRAGVANGICDQLRIATIDKADEVRSTGTELVVVKKQAMIDKWGDVFATKRTRSGVSRGDAYTAGQKDGRNVDINRRGITGGNSNRLLN
jgi:hypothetical protein